MARAVREGQRSLYLWGKNFEGLAGGRLLVHMSGQARRARYDEQRFAVSPADSHIGNQSCQSAVHV